MNLSNFKKTYMTVISESNDSELKNYIRFIVEEIISEQKDAYSLKGTISKDGKTNNFEVIGLDLDRMSSSAASDQGYVSKMLMKQNKNLTISELDAIEQHLDSDSGQEDDGESNQNGYVVSHMFKRRSEYNY